MSSARSLKPPSASTLTMQGSRLMARASASASVSSRATAAPSRLPAAAATPKLVVATAANPCAANAAADAQSQALGSRSGRSPWWSIWNAAKLLAGRLIG
jgi:hypothetical protein